MAHPIQIPRLGWSMEEGVFVEWLRADGDTIEPGDVLFNLEGEKAIQEIESIDAGVLRIPADAPAEGDTVLVGQVIGWLCAEDEDPPAEFPAVDSAAADDGPPDTPDNRVLDDVGTKPWRWHRWLPPPMGGRTSSS